PSNIILFYNPVDKKLPEAFIEGGRPSISKYEKVINATRNELLSERELMRKTNLKQTQIRVIKSDLVEQGIIREVTVGRSKKFEYITNAPVLNINAFEELRKTKKADLEQMIQYVETTQSRMKFLCDFLGDSTTHNFTNCDNTDLKKITVEQPNEEWSQKLQDFREDYFPNLEVEARGSNIVNGVAASYYGVSNVGAALHRSKYETKEDFPDFLLKLCLKAYRKKFGQEKFDFIAYVPPTSSGDLVKNFATKLSQVLKFPITHDLIKNRPTNEQKVFENTLLKSDNIKGAFSFKNPAELVGKSILLIDDIFDSGATIKEVGRLFTNLGALKITPLVIAKTLGGVIV
ncbi:MAG: phosphoribosyltransferase family protein, partial [Sediminibacterium sp.]|nr:phosphoribosyltransferase family protein [Sediminibacterium sp.]